MDNPLENWHEWNSFNEAYEIVKSVILVGKDENTYRIDIMEGYGGKGAKKGIWYEPRCYIQNWYTLKSTYSAGEDEKFEEVRLWVAMRPTRPTRIDKDSVNKALTEALDFLSERTKERNPGDNGPKDGKIINLFKKDKDED